MTTMDRGGSVSAPNASSAVRLGALRVYLVRGPLEMVTVFPVGSGRFARFLRTVSGFRTQSTVFDWIEPVYCQYASSSPSNGPSGLAIGARLRLALDVLPKFTGITFRLERLLPIKQLHRNMIDER